MLLYFLVYVDDLIITGSDPSLVDTIMRQLDSKFSRKDLGFYLSSMELKFCLLQRVFYYLKKNNVINLLSKHNMIGSNPVSTSFVICTSLIAKDGNGTWWPSTSPDDSVEYFLYRE